MSHTVKALLGTALLGVALLLPAVAQTGQDAASSNAVAEIGKPAPTFSLLTPQGKGHGYGGEGQTSKATVLFFVATQCPVSNAYNERMVQLAQEYTPKDVRFLAINANRQESHEEIAKHAKAQKFPFPVLVDVGNVVADRYGAKVTPHAYVIDSQGILRYRGRIDDSQDPSGVKSRDLKAAIDAVLNGQQPPVTDTKAFGCAIKRMEKE